MPFSCLYILPRKEMWTQNLEGPEWAVEGFCSHLHKAPLSILIQLSLPFHCPLPPNNSSGKAFLQRHSFPCPRAKKEISQYYQKNWNLPPFKYMACTKCRAGWCQPWDCFSLLKLPGVPKHLCWQCVWAPLPSTTLSPSSDAPPSLHRISPLRTVVCNTGATNSLSCRCACRVK